MQRSFTTLIYLVSVSAIQAVWGQASPASLPDLHLSIAGEIFAVSRQSDGKIIVGGRFSSVNGIYRNNLARINPNGTLDLTWNPDVRARNPPNLPVIGTMVIDGS